MYAVCIVRMYVCMYCMYVCMYCMYVRMYVFYIRTYACMSNELTKNLQFHRHWGHSVLVPSGDGVHSWIIHFHKILKAECGVPCIHNVLKGVVRVPFSHIGHIGPLPAAIPGDGDRLRIGMHFAHKTHQATRSNCLGGFVAHNGRLTYVKDNRVDMWHVL